VARYAQTSDRPAVGRTGGARSHLAPGAVGSRSAPVGQFCDYAAVRLRQCGRADRGRGFHGFHGYGRRGWAVRWEAHWHRPVQLVRRAHGAGEAPRRDILGDSGRGWSSGWYWLYYGTLHCGAGAAGRMVEVLEAKQPGLKNLLRSKGVGDNALVASLLIRQSERYWARRR